MKVQRNKPMHSRNVSFMLPTGIREMRYLDTVERPLDRNILEFTLLTTPLKGRSARLQVEAMCSMM